MEVLGGCEHPDLNIGNSMQVLSKCKKTLLIDESSLQLLVCSFVHLFSTSLGSDEITLYPNVEIIGVWLKMLGISVCLHLECLGVDKAFLYLWNQEVF